MEKIAEEVFDHRVTRSRLQAFLADPTRALVIAAKNGAVVGQLRAHLILHPDQGPECLIENLGVSPAQQRQGIASRLVAEALAIAGEWGCEGVYVMTEPDNAPARGFYAAQGWSDSTVTLYDGRLMPPKTPS